MKTKLKKYNLSAPGTQKRIDEIVHNCFLREGSMVAFPLCFPGASVPIPMDESRITALDVLPDGTVYGGTSGKKVHVFTAMFHGVTGFAFDMQTLEGFEQCAAVCCGKDALAVLANHATSGALIRGKFQPMPFDCIQEWGFEQTPFDAPVEIVPGERVVHAVTDGKKETVIGITEAAGEGKMQVSRKGAKTQRMRGQSSNEATTREYTGAAGHLFTYSFSTGKVEVHGEIGGGGRIVLCPSGKHVYGLDDKSSLWSFDLGKRQLARNKVPMPKSDWSSHPIVWARDAKNSILYAADGDGTLYSFRPEKGFSRALGNTPHSPVTTLAATFDGRVFGTCGEGMEELFCYLPREKTISRIGLAVSTIERRRYGYCYGDAVVGRDGQVYFGENDNLGHLWIYFPTVG